MEKLVYEFVIVYIWCWDAVQKVDNDLLNQSTEKSETKQVDAPLNTIGKKQREFSYQELVKATNNFRRDRYLGEGGFGQVYKGNLENPNQVNNFDLFNFLKCVLTFNWVIKWSGCGC